MFRWLTSRMSVMLVAVLGIGLIITAMLITDRFQRALMRLSTSHYAFAIDQIRQYTETNLTFGIALADQKNVGQEISKLRQAYQQILSVEIFDTEGIVLFSTDPSFTGALVSEKWQQLSRSQQPVWDTSERGVGVVGGPVHINSEHIGSIVIRYTWSVLDQQVSEQVYYMAIASAIIVVVVAIVIALGSIYLLRDTRADISDLREALNDVDKGRDTGGALDKASTAYPEVANFATTAFGLQHDVDVAIDEIRRLDEGDTE